MQEIIRLQTDAGGDDLEEQMRGQNTTYRTSDIIIMGVPTEESAQPKSLQINMNSSSAAITSLVVFKQVVRTISL